MKELANIISKLKDENEVLKFFDEILTASEIEVLSKRWRILKMLDDGTTQREIAKTLNVSLCKVTRGAKILKTKDSIVKKFMKGQDDANFTNKYTP